MNFAARFCEAAVFIMRGEKIAEVKKMVLRCDFE